MNVTLTDSSAETAPSSRASGNGSARDDDLRRCSRILVVDDEASNLKLLSLMLRTEGYRQLELVQDPREAVARYRAVRPDLVLLDINMPHLDGHEVLRRLRELGDDPAPPVLVLTAQSDEAVLLKALTGGANDFVCKPFNRRELLARVHNLLMAHLAHRLLSDQHAVLERMVADRSRDLLESRLDLVRRLGRAAEFRDNETGRHILRISHGAALLASAAGWTPDACEMMLHASPMHDIGKIGIPDGILLKPGPLEPSEREIMQRHTLIGERILAGESGELIAMAREIAVGHHERWDGSGYPHRLAGAAIPESARVVAIVDVFDALTSERPYKTAWTVQAALAYMADHAGRHFDPWLLQTFFLLMPQIELIRDRYAEPASAPMQSADNDLFERL